MVIGMVTRKVTVTLDATAVDAIDQLAGDEGISRAVPIRCLLDRALGGTERDLVVNPEALDASFGALRDAVEPRGPGEREAHLGRIRNLRA